uniref:helix-turn-helix domain-containing protein n=1 Tax=Acetatifactor sp. TaxID=1872090 RepID=UPI0040567C2F
MKYEAELHFLQTAFEKCRLQTRIHEVGQPLDKAADLGLRSFLGIEAYEEVSLRRLLSPIQSNTIYKMTDSFLCRYIFLVLPDTKPQILLMIGPYRTSELTEQRLLELAEQFDISPRYIPFLKNYYGELPILVEENPLFVMLDVFGEKIWSNTKFSVINVDQEQLGAISPLSSVSEKNAANPEKVMWTMQAMERRYEMENELMQMVSQGQLHKAERILAFLSTTSFEERVSDSVRNMKNYGIIMNTLLRKAAENGGVHPIYLDSVSSGFAKKIESINVMAEMQLLMSEMIRSYCRLVSKHSIRRYSPPVQKAITYIDSDLTADLSLSALATMQNVSAGYLSALFKQETGQTITEHVNQKRIKHAMRLLKTTKLQVQTIAQHCGIVDVHYFSKLFKKYVGTTPKAYRENS